MKHNRWIVAAVIAIAIIAASVMFRREAFLPDGASNADADPATAQANAAATLNYIFNESYQGFKTLNINAATRNVIRALADIVRGKFVNGVYPSNDVRLHILSQAHEIAYNFEHGVSTYETIVEPRTREKVSEADYLAAIEKHRGEYVKLMNRTIFDEFGTMEELADISCSSFKAGKSETWKKGVRWALQRRCG